MKRCARCGETKPLDQFSPNNLSKDGCNGYCKPCAAAHRREARRIMREGKKRCARCGEVKPIEEFYGNRTGKNRYQSWCKDCQKQAVVAGYRENPEKHATYNREWGRRNPDRKADIALKSRLGLPHGTYAAMLAAQEGKCAICGTTEPGTRTQRFHMDHDKASGEVRALLCSRCNTGIGQLRHDPVILASAIRYLHDYQPKAPVLNAEDAMQAMNR